MAKRVLLIISGSVAAYKSLDLIRMLREKGLEVTCVLTRGGQEFVTPLSCASLSGNPVHTAMFDAEAEAKMSHIQLSREHDLVVVAPASADILAKMTHGLADDLASTLLLATDKPVLVAPAMNVKMWEHPATQRNVRTLRGDGIAFVGPVAGDLACGEQGEGRMADIADIARAIDGFIAGKGNRRQAQEKKPLSGVRVLVTSGPTVEPIDPVRYIANRSSGKQGNAIATALAEQGAEVVLISGPSTPNHTAGVHTVRINTAEQMFNACKKYLPDVDVAICAAAVSDWKVDVASKQKIKKDKKGGITLTLSENPDILAFISKPGKHRPKLVIGFAAETQKLKENAEKKRKEKGCDWILANDVSNGMVFGKDATNIHLFTKESQENWVDISKKEVAERLAERIVDFLGSPTGLRVVKESGDQKIYH